MSPCKTIPEFGIHLHYEIDTLSVWRTWDDIERNSDVILTHVKLSRIVPAINGGNPGASPDLGRGSIKVTHLECI